MGDMMWQGTSLLEVCGNWPAGLNLPTTTRTTGDLRALVVEDDPLNLMVIKKLLSMSGVTSIDVACNGAEVWPRNICGCWM